MAKGIIESPGWCPEVEGVESDKDSIGRGTVEPIEGHTVRASFSLENISDLSSGDKFAIDTPKG